MKNEFFCVNVSKYDSKKNFNVVRPASLDNPQNNAVMFVTERYSDRMGQLLKCDQCIVFVPALTKISEDVKKRHVIIYSDDPRLSYCKFYEDNCITNYSKICEYRVSNGACIAEGAVIGEGCKLFPDVYIGSEVVLGNNVYIASGVKIIGKVIIGNNVVIKENAVIGADGLSTNRDENGHPVTMPQFGRVIIGNDVIIGALTVIARGAIDDTFIADGARIDNMTFISHNVNVGEESFVVGESLLCGSSSVGRRCFIGGNSCIRDGISVGNNCMVGMGANVLHDVEDNSVIVGNPARFYKARNEVNYE